MLAYLKQEGEWSEDDDKFIVDKQIFIENLKKLTQRLLLIYGKHANLLFLGMIQ